MGGNDGSRMAQIQALIKHGSLIIDDSTFSTGDKYLFNHHFYSDKPPILAILVSPIYLALDSMGISFENHLNLACYLITLLSIGVLSALGLAVFRKILTDFFLTKGNWANLITLITGTGTLILPFSLVFNNHIVSGVLILIGFYFLLKFRRSSHIRAACVSGLFFSLAASIDIGCFLFIPIGFLLFSRKSINAGLLFAISCLPAITLYLFLNLQTSGSLIPPAMNAKLWDYPGSDYGGQDAQNLSGLAKHSNIFESLVYSFHMLVGNRGLFSHTPIALLSIIGLLVIYKNRLFLRDRMELTCFFIASILYIGIYIFRTNDYSGFSFGVRWFTSIMFILCLSIAGLEGKVRSSRKFKFLLVGIVCLSILFSLIGTCNPYIPIDEDSLQQAVPPNTLISSSKLYLEASLFDKARLFLSGFIIYALFYKFVKHLESA